MYLPNLSITREMPYSRQINHKIANYGFPLY